MTFVEAIERVNMDDMTVTLADGTVLPITDMFDGDGDECEADFAVMIVAGNDDFGWIDVAVGDHVTVH